MDCVDVDCTYSSPMYMQMHAVASGTKPPQGGSDAETCSRAGVPKECTTTAVWYIKSDTENDGLALM